MPSTGASSTDPDSFPPLCDNAKLDTSLAPAGGGQKASVFVISVKNAGPRCDIDFLPYVWITAGQASSPARIEPLVENGLGGRGNVIDAGQTLYAGIDLDPHSASNAVAGYTTLEVIPNRIAGAGDKGARALQLPAPAKVADAQLGTYSRDIAGALKAMTYASIPEE